MIELSEIKKALKQSPILTPVSSHLTASAVLVPLIERDNGLQLLLTQRTEHLRHHAGQISFPGGRKDDSDSDLIHTALRETHEEVGIAADSISILGQLPINPTVSGFYIQPIVGLVSNNYQMILSTDEVSEAFEVPLDFLFNTSNQTYQLKEYQGKQYPIYSIPYQHRNIWGATANIIVQFSKLLKTR